MRAVPRGAALARELDALAAAGYVAMVAVFRGATGELRTVSLLDDGADVAELFEWLAGAEIETAPPSVEHEAAVTTNDTGDRSFHDVVTEMDASGLEPFLIVFLDERERIEVLADPAIDDLSELFRDMAAALGTRPDDGC